MMFAIENLEVYSVTYHIEADSAQEAYDRWPDDAKAVDLEYHADLGEYLEVEVEPIVYPLGEIL